MRIMPFMKRKNGVQFAGVGLDTGISTLANKTDLTAIIMTGTTNTSGSTITAGTWFYLNGKLVKAKVDIASNVTFTKDTNYEEKTIGEELIELNSNISVLTEDKTNKATKFTIVGQTQFNINTPDVSVGFLMIGSYDTESLSTSGFGLYYIRKNNTDVGYKAIAAYSRLQSISSSSNTSITVSLTQQTNVQGELFILA